jgi:hypothetical protein
MALAPNAALAEESPAQEAGIGTAAAIGSLLYAPVKIAYALGGTVVGGLAWCFSAGDKEVAVPIFNRAVRGDYVLTPDHVRGERKIEFIGRDPEPAVATGPPAPAYPPPASDPAW